MSRKQRVKQEPPVLTPTEAILESISEGVFTVDGQWIITSFNRAAEKITGVSRKDAIGHICSEVFRCSMCGENCALEQTLRSGKPMLSKSAYIINAAGNRVSISISTAVLKDPKTGKIMGGAETFRDLSEIEALRQELKGKYQISSLVSQSPLMQKLLDFIPTIAASSSTVLILGETGTGKEYIARTIHSLSMHSQGPFIAVNCSALPDALLESELFGYKVGAFTGANKDKPGRFKLARGGTIFLDEIGDINPAIQAKLLRVLQEHSYEPLGATRSENSDARVIVATNKELSKLIDNKEFREDLYYRINVVRIELPPLRKRKEDIPLLVDQFISRFNQVQEKNVEGISWEALSLLTAYDWPGNIRELENVIERAFVHCKEGLIDIKYLPEEITMFPKSSFGIKTLTVHNLIDIQAIQKALEGNNNDRNAAAKALGIHKTTLYRRMKQLGIFLPKKTTRVPSKKNQ